MSIIDSILHFADANNWELSFTGATKCMAPDCARPIIWEHGMAVSLRVPLSFDSEDAAKPTHFVDLCPLHFELGASWLMGEVADGRIKAVEM